MAETEYTFISIRVTLQEKEELLKGADSENRTLANYVRNAALDRARGKQTTAQA